MAALGITPDQLAQPDVVDRLRVEVERGAALFRCELLEDLRSLRKDGKVNAVLAGLRQALGWDRRDSGKPGDRRPDDEGALAELAKFLAGVAASRPEK